MCIAHALCINLALCHCWPMSLRTHADNGEFIGLRDAAEILDRDKKQVIRWIENGLLPVVTKLSGARGAYVLLRADVERFAEERLTGVSELADAAPAPEAGNPAAS